MKKMMVFASVVAVALCATAEDWFNGGIKEGWPNEATNGAWSNTTGSSYAAGKVTVSATTDDPLTFTATEAKFPATNELAIVSTITFTPFAKTAMPAVPEEAKAGVIAVVDDAKTNCYVLAKGTGEANEWTATSIPAPASAEVTVTFTDEKSATYKIGEATTNVTIKTIEKIQKVCMSGDGTISSLYATFVVKVTPIVPGEDSKTYDSKEAAEAAAQKAVVVRPTVITDEIISEADYQKLFVVKAVETTPGSGVWTLVADLTDDVKAAEQEKADDAQVSLAATAATTPSATISNAQPGLYYGIAGETEVTSVQGAEGRGWKLAGKNGTVTVTIEKVGTDKGFYQIRISPAPKNLD